MNVRSYIKSVILMIKINKHGHMNAVLGFAITLHVGH